MERESFILTLKSAVMITPSVRHLEFISQNNQPFNFIPGQFITFHFEWDGISYQRSYSIASIPGHTSGIEIAASPFPGGPGTRVLFGIEPGDKLETTGPFGRLILRDEPVKRYILVATGTGVTPYRAMLPELLQRINTQNIKVIILQGVQTPNDLLYREDFLNFVKESPHLEFHACYSRELPEHPQQYEHKGYVQQNLEWLNLNPQNDVIYLCGNPNMIDQTFNLLRDKGFDTRQVRREKYISPKK